MPSVVAVLPAGSDVIPISCRREDGDAQLVFFMDLSASDGIFISGLTCKLVAGPGKQADTRTRTTPPPQPPRTANTPQAHDSDYEAFTEPEEECGGPETDHPDMFEELFGFKRKAGRPPGPNAVAKAKVSTARDGPDSRFVRKIDGRSKAGKAAKAAKTAFTLGEKDISVKDMLDQGMFQPGEMNVTAICKGVTCTASLTREGDIVYEGNKFNTPGAFSHFVKIKYAHNRPGGDGWRYVHVNGVSLHDWRCLMQGIPVPVPGKPGRPPGSGKKDGGAAPRKQPSPEPEPGGRPREARLDPELPAAVPMATEAGGQDVERGRRANWVQCADCCQWRVVPDEFWPMIEASDEQEWFCKDATWDVALHEPYTPLCGQQ